MVEWVLVFLGKLVEASNQQSQRERFLPNKRTGSPWKSERDRLTQPCSKVFIK